MDNISTASILPGYTPHALSTVISTMTPDSLTPHEGNTLPPSYSTLTINTLIENSAAMSDELTDALSDATSTDTVLPSPVASRLVFSDKTQLSLADRERHNDTVDSDNRPRHITLRDYRQLDPDERIQFLLENAALICTCIRSDKALKQLSGQPSLNEAKHMAKYPNGTLIIDDSRKTYTAQQIGNHRLCFHGPIKAYDKHSRQIFWLCTIPTCVQNLLPFKVTDDQVSSKQSLLTDALDDIVLALQASTTCRDLMDHVKSIPRNHNSVILAEIANKYSLLHLVITETFNDARFPAKLRKPRH
jgi:hypothetical protein